MDASERWRVKPEVARHGDSFTAWSDQLPGAYGEGDTPEEAVESFWEIVDFFRVEMAVPGWPHARDGWAEVFSELAELDETAPDDFGPEDFGLEDWVGGDRDEGDRE